MNVIFEHSDGRKTVLGTATNKQDAWKIVRKFLDEHNYHSPYQRVSVISEERHVWIDVGSHSEFFHYTDLTDEELEEFTI